MCGIAGFNRPDQELIARMNQSLIHRGPDMEGSYVDAHVSLGNRRLAIQDTSQRGRQPMSHENLVIVFNGEIYNFRELREQLESEGYQFQSETDTEVVLYAYHKWGPAAVEKFNGMWGLCIYDKERQTLFLSRDRFGIKPLYYYSDGEKFIFASELRAITLDNLNLDIDLRAVNFYFYQKYIGGDLTIYKNCFKLRPGENLLYRLDTHQLTRTAYYDLEREVVRHQARPVAERLDEVEQTLASAVNARLVADVPVGGFLSGGVDSSIICALVHEGRQQFPTFSVGFQDASYDEVKFADIVATHLGTDHQSEYFEINEETAQQVLGGIDEPFGDSSILPTYLLCKMARRQVTVALSGDAGDEVFAGYDTYKAHRLAQYVPASAVSLARPLINRLPTTDRKVTLRFKMRRFVRDYDRNLCRRHLDWMATFDDPLRRKLLGERFIDAPTIMPVRPERTLLRAQLNDIHNYLPEDILKKVDIASMLNSLEVRVPFLDHRLVPLVLSLPERYRLRRLTTKWLLKRIAARRLPGRIVHRRKRGFSVPLASWVRRWDFIRTYLADRRYYDHGLYDYDYIQGLLAGHLERRTDNARELWLVFVFNYWHRRRSRPQER